VVQEEHFITNILFNLFGFLLKDQPTRSGGQDLFSYARITQQWIMQ
jgi:hypothetical protein